MRVRVTFVTSLLALLACSGATGSFGGGPLGGGVDGGSSDDASGSSDDSSSEGASSSSGDDSGGTDGPWDEPCPDISGAYQELSWNGVGCGNSGAAATVCITVAQPQCAFQLVSAQVMSTSDTLDGIIALLIDGSFSSASLQFGTVQRTDCTGQWDAGSQTLTIDCGGMDSDQSCVVTMTRTGSTC